MFFLSSDARIFPWFLGISLIFLAFVDLYLGGLNIFCFLATSLT